jgi:hypothetical protein
MELRIDPRRAVRRLFALAVLLIAAHLAVMYARFVLGHGRLFGLTAKFDVNNEMSAPTFFSVLLLLACAATLVVVAQMPSNSASDRRHWNGLAAIFLFVAFDEYASIHELWIAPMRHFLPDKGVLHFGWVVPYAILVLVVGILYLRFVLRLAAPTRGLVLTAGCLYLGGALVLEMLGGWYFSQVSGRENLQYMTIVAGEELLEMSGAILFLHALLDLLRRRIGSGSTVIRFGPT